MLKVLSKISELGYMEISMFPGSSPLLVSLQLSHASRVLPCTYIARTASPCTVSPPWHHTLLIPDTQPLQSSFSDSSILQDPCADHVPRTQIGLGFNFDSTFLFKSGKCPQAQGQGKQEFLLSIIRVFHGLLSCTENNCLIYFIQFQNCLQEGTMNKRSAYSGGSMCLLFAKLCNMPNVFSRPCQHLLLVTQLHVISDISYFIDSKTLLIIKHVIILATLKQKMLLVKHYSLIVILYDTCICHTHPLLL